MRNDTPCLSRLTANPNPLGPARIGYQPLAITIIETEYALLASANQNIHLILGFPPRRQAVRAVRAVVDGWPAVDHIDAEAVMLRRSN